MIQLGLSARDRRTLVIGGSLVATLFALGRGLPGVLRWQHDVISEAADASRRVAAMRTRVHALPALRDSLRIRSNRLAALDSSLVAGPTAAAAAADLASTLGDLAEEASIKVGALQMRADSATTGALAHVSVRLTGVTDVAGLSAFLQSVDNNESPMLVSELSVTQPEPAAADSRPEQLRVDVVVDAIGRVTKVKAP